MTVKNLKDVSIKAVKILASGMATASLIEMGYHGGRMLGNDIECVVKVVDNKINPKVMKKPHWYSKPKLYNTRTKKFVDAKKTVKPAKKVKTAKKSVSKKSK